MAEATPQHYPHQEEEVDAVLDDDGSCYTVVVVVVALDQ